MQKAAVIETADQDQAPGTSAVNKKILERIQKCLDRAHHANSSELEAKAALFVSQKLMSQHNVTQADLLASDGSNSKASFGGHSKVRITKTNGSDKRVMMEAFAGKLANAMCTCFDCKCYSTYCGDCVEWSFFGIASNTVAAAMSFEMAHNRILNWACAYKGGKPTFSYRIGVADGLAAMANREKQRELDQARRKELGILASQEHDEAENPRREIERLWLLPAHYADPLSAIGYGDEILDQTNIKTQLDTSSCDEGEDVNSNTKADFDMDDIKITDLCDNVDETIDMYVKREPTEPPNPTEMPLFNMDSKAHIDTKTRAPPATEASPWETGVQLIRFRATAEQVAEDYLKEKKIKLSQGRQRYYTIRDFDAYRQGQADSAMIEINWQTRR
jgi:hypothetical protein